MAHYDDATKDFMQKVGNDPSSEEKHIPFREGVNAARMAVTAKNPAKLLTLIAGKNVANTAFGSEKNASSRTPIQVYELMNTRFGREWFDWEPETLWSELQGATEEVLPEEYRSLILCLQLLVNTNQAHEHWHVFEKVVNAINLNPVDFSILQPPELNEVARALKVINSVRPKTDFEEEIDAYIAAIARSSGVVYLPKELFTSGSQLALDELNNDMDLKVKVEMTWPNLPKKEESLEVKVQILRLREIQSYA